MINLLPWREQLLLRKKRVALSWIAFGYLLLLIMGSIFFSKAYDEKNEGIDSLQHLHHEVNQLQLHAKGVFEKETTQKQLVAINLIVWKRYWFIEKIIRFMVQMPDAVMLARIYCVKEICDIELNAKNPNIMGLFSGDQIQEIKPGDCLLCYQAKAIVKL